MSKRARKTIQKGYVPDEVYKVESRKKLQIDQCER